MGIRKALTVFGMLAFSWLLVIGTVFVVAKLYRVLFP